MKSVDWGKVAKAVGAAGGSVGVVRTVRDLFIRKPLAARKLEKEIKHLGKMLKRRTLSETEYTELRSLAMKDFLKLGK